MSQLDNLTGRSPLTDISALWSGMPSYGELEVLEVHSDSDSVTQVDTE